MDFTNAATKLHFDQHGSGSMTLVLLHGLGCTAAVWEEVIPFLAARYRILVPDLRGCGRSDHGETTITLELLAEDLDALIREQAGDGPVVVVGHSLGGVVTQQYLCSNYPPGSRGDPGHGALKAAALLSTSSKVGRKATERWALVAERARERGPSASPKAYVSGFAPAFAEAHPEAVDKVAAAASQTRAESYAQLALAASSYDFTEELGRVSCPVLVAQGDEDLLTPMAGSVILERAIRKSSRQVIEGAGHYLPMEAAQKLARCLEGFLSGLE